MILVVLIVILVVFCFTWIGIIPYGIYIYPLLGCGIYSSIKFCHQIKNSKSLLIDVKFWTWVTLFLGTYIAPLIHFSEKKWITNYSTPPHDWMPWAFVVSVIYFIGFIFLDVFMLKDKNVEPTKYLWVLNPKKIKILYFLMIIS